VDADLERLTTEELRQLRDQLKARPAMLTQARLHEHTTTLDVLRVMSKADDVLTELRTILRQWQANLDRFGAQRLAAEDRRRASQRELA
jgi:hypothetical protein